MGDETLRVRVRRHDGSTGAEAEYAVPLDDGEPVLSVLERIRAEQDPSLAFRCACRHGVCGECAVEIDGRPALACVTRVGEARTGEALAVGPLRGFEPVRDLVVDRGPFWEAWRRARPWLEASGPAPEAERPMTPEQLAEIEGADTCLRCGICWSACPVVRSGGAFLGPQALLEAMGRVLDPRDGAGRQRLAAVEGDDGVWRCHGTLACLDHCPVELSPADAVFRLRVLRPSDIPEADDGA